MLTRLLAWLRRLFGLPEMREAHRLSAGDASGRSADVLREEIKRKGPLKPSHRRQIVRDERLMPKPAKRTALLKPKPEMSKEHATRLFAGTLRTRNRQLRTLDADVAQLERLGLPIWRSEAELAKGLGISVKHLRHYSVHRQRDRAPHYLAYAIKKRSGGLRVIHAPKQRLKAILRTLNRELVAKLPVSEHAHGFVKQRSVKTGAAPHVGKAVVLRIDLKDFFPSVTSERVRGLLIAYGYGYEVAATLAVLVTEAERQPVELDGVTYHVPVGPRSCVQGAPTSPGLCNAILLRMDRRLAGIARKHGYSYTRYADDMSFSGPAGDAVQQLRKAVERTIRDEGFEVNQAKTRVMKRGGRQRVTGVTVNSVLGLSRQERRRIRAMLHQASMGSAPPERKAELVGLLAWVKMLNESQSAALQRRG